MKIRLILMAALAIVVVLYIGVVIGYNMNENPVKANDQTAGEPIAPDFYEPYSLANAERTQAGLQPLMLDPKLNASAQEKCNDMVARDYPSHITPDGYDPWPTLTKYNVRYESAGENLAYGYLNAKDFITGWMKNPGHKANIVNPVFTNIGYGVCSGENYQNNGKQFIVVQHFTQAR